jgi:PHP family Zn ribbon phosphoesterase
MSDTLTTLAAKAECRNALADEVAELRRTGSPRLPFVEMHLRVICKQMDNLIGQVNWKESKHADAD